METRAFEPEAFLASRESPEVFHCFRHRFSVQAHCDLACSLTPVASRDFDNELNH